MLSALELAQVVVLEPAQRFLASFTDVADPLGERFAVFGNSLGYSADNPHILQGRGHRSRHSP